MFKMAFLKMAYFSLWRRKSRTILIIGMIVFGLIAMIFSQGLYDGMIIQMTEDHIRTSTGDITLYKKGYEESRLLAKNIKAAGQIESILDRDKNITDYVSRIRCEGVVSSARYAQGANIIGIDIAKEGPFINYKEPVIKGAFSFDEHHNSLIIGWKLAEKLKIGVGKKLVIQGQALNKEIVAAGMRVSGIIKTNNPEIDLAGVLMDKQQMQELFKTSGVTEFCMLTAGGENLDTVKNELALRMKGAAKEELELFTWKELYPIILSWSKIFSYFVYASYAVMFLVVALGIFFIMFVSIMERIKEYGVLMALGTPFRSICGIVLYESLIIGGLGYAFGSLSGLILLGLSGRYGIDLSYFSSGLSGIGMAAVMYPVLKPEYFLLGFVSMCVSSVLAVVFPLIKLKSFRAAEAIRYV